jgi:hypothetical protein
LEVRGNESYDTLIQHAEKPKRKLIAVAGFNIIGSNVAVGKSLDLLTGFVFAANFKNIRPPYPS